MLFYKMTATLYIKNYDNSTTKIDFSQPIYIDELLRANKIFTQCSEVRQKIDKDYTIDLSSYVRVFCDGNLFYMKPGTTIVDIVESFPGVLHANLTCACGGALSCSTCHLIVSSHQDCMPAITEDEEDLLEVTAVESTAHSRLGCQIIFDFYLDRIQLVVPL